MEENIYSEIDQLLDEGIALGYRSGYGLTTLVIEPNSQDGEKVQAMLAIEARLSIVTLNQYTSAAVFFEELRNAIASGKHIGIHLLSSPPRIIIDALKILADSHCLDRFLDDGNRQVTHLLPSQRVFLIIERTTLTNLPESSLVTHFNQTISV